jgi:hypothetical protein
MNAVGSSTAIIGGSWDNLITEAVRKNSIANFCERAHNYQDIKAMRNALITMLRVTGEPTHTADPLCFYVMGMSAIKLRLLLREWCIQASRVSMTRTDQAHTWNVVHSRKQLLELLLQVGSATTKEAAYLFLNTIRINIHMEHMARLSPWDFARPAKREGKKKRRKRNPKAHQKTVVPVVAVVNAELCSVEEDVAKMSKEELRELGLDDDEGDEVDELDEGREAEL